MLSTENNYICQNVHSKMFIQECSKCSCPSLLCFYIGLECYPLSSKPHLSLAAQVHDAKKIPLFLFSDA